jgi:hypothetical protein
MMMASAKAAEHMSKFVEDDDGNMDFEIEDDAFSNIGKAKPQAPASVADDRMVDLDDPFADITFDAAESDNKAAREDDKFKKLIMPLLDRLQPKKDEKVIVEACEELMDMVDEHPADSCEILTKHGVVPIMELLEIANTNILLAGLQLVNQTVSGGGDTARFQQGMSLVGLIPAIIRLAGPSFPLAVRTQASIFVRYLCQTNDSTRKMFVACGMIHRPFIPLLLSITSITRMRIGGLPVLVGFLRGEYGYTRKLMLTAIDCIKHVCITFITFRCLRVFSW